MYKYLLFKDKKNRFFFKKKELLDLKIKFIKKNKKINLLTNIYVDNRFKIFKKRVRVVNRCLETSKARSVFKLFRFSRVVLKKHIIKGDICGFDKYSW